MGAGDDPHRVQQPREGVEARRARQRAAGRARAAPGGGRARGSRRAMWRASASSRRSRPRRATRRSVAPAWRTPEDAPLAADLEVELGQAEAVDRLGQRLQPAGALLGRGLAEQQAQPRVRAAPDPARAAGGAGRARSGRRPPRRSSSRWGRRCPPRRRSSRRAGRCGPTRSPSIAARFSSPRWAPWARPTVKSANGPARRRSASLVAARASAASPSSTRGHMTYA